VQIVDRSHQLAVGGLRIVVGVIFLWAGLEKLLGAEPFSAAGFLQFATGGSLGWPFVSGEVAEGTVFNPTHDFWLGLATSEAAMGFINFIVPFGQIGIGVSLILGLFTRFGAAMGTLMMLLFFVAAWEFEFGIVNQHLTYALVTAFLGYIGAGNYVGLDRWFGAQAPAWVRRWLMSGEPAAESPSERWAGAAPA
jgi:thiosulfate dehydrogenase [quinone] large subunit